MTGDVLGTLRYMSPEQAAGGSRVLDHHTDIYSLGVTLYELLTLRPPFPGDDRQKLLRQITDDEPPPPRRLNPAIPRDLETIILKAAAKEPQRRYATAQEMADDLKRFLSDEPIRARRPSLVDRTSKWARRHRAVVCAALAALLVSVVVVAVSMVITLAAYQGEKEQRALAAGNAAKAQKNYEAAREAVKQMLTRVADEEVGRIPEMKEVRRRLLEDAAAFYTELIKLNPRDPLAYYERGQVFDMLVRYGKVRADYEKAIALDPDNGEFHFALARFLHSCPDVAYRDLQCALLHIQWAVRLAPHNFVYHHDLACVYRALGEKEKARAEYLESARLCDGDPRPLLAQACAVVGDLPGALESWKQLEALAPDSPLVQEQLATTYLALGQHDNAVAAATKAIAGYGRLRNESADNRAFYRYETRGDAYTALKMYQQALADYDKSVELGRFRSYTYKRRAKAHFYLKNYEKALADLAKAVELKPDDTSNLTRIPPADVAKCPDGAFRKGLLELADKTIELTNGAERAYAARARLRAAFGLPEKPPTEQHEPEKPRQKTTDKPQSR